MNWFRTTEGKKALAIGYVVALVIIVFEAIRYIITLILNYVGLGFSVFGFHFSYFIGVLVVIGLLYYLIRKSNL